MDISTLKPAIEPRKSFEGMKNIYLCSSCGHGFVSLDLDDGTTPFMTSCLNPACKEMASSMFYRCPQEMLANVQPAIEWYKPTKAQMLKKPPHAKHHVEMGGLLSRPFGSAGTGK